MTSLLFVHVGDVGVTSFTSGFASESAPKLDSLDLRIRIRIRALNGRFHWIQSESIFGMQNDYISHGIMTCSRRSASILPITQTNVGLLASCRTSFYGCKRGAYMYTFACDFWPHLHVRYNHSLSVEIISFRE